MSPAIDVAGVLVSVALPWLAGTLLVRLLLRSTAGASWPLAAGYGYFLGAIGATLLLRATSAAGIGWRLPVLDGACVALAAAAWLASRRCGAAAGSGELPGRLGTEPPLLRVLFWCAAALIAIRLAGICVEVAVSPLRFYDAWAQWGTKARVWFAAGRITPFVSPEAWLARGDPALYTDVNPGHPGTVPLVQLWTALHLREWDDALISAPWPALAIALALAFYAQSRAVGASAGIAMVATWLLMSLPVLGMHVAVGGGADLFMGAAYGMAAMAAWRWTLDRDPALAVLAVLGVGAGAWIKVEGALWMATLIPGIVVAWNRRAGFALAALAVAAFAAFLVFGPDRVPLLGYALLRKPVNVVDTVAGHLFVIDDWHLAAYATLAVLTLRWRELFSARLAPLTMTMLAAGGLVVVVFFFTNAALGVADESLGNRFLLHGAPALAFYLLVVYLAEPAASGAAASENQAKAADA